MFQFSIFKKKFRIEIPFLRKKRISWPARIGILVFYLQFFVSIYIAYQELKFSCIILSSELCPATLDLVFYHYLKLMFIMPIVALSFLFSILEIIVGWDFKIEQQLMSVFIFLGWIIFGFMSLFLGPEVAQS